MIIRIATFLFVIALCTQAFGQSKYRNIVIDSKPLSSKSACEPSIVINPKAPNKMVVGTVMDGVFYSSDFGQTWSQGTLKSKLGVYGDPCLVADNDGMYYYFHLSDVEKKGWGSKLILDRIVCQQSSNGKTWKTVRGIGHNPPKQQDKPWACFDEYSGNLSVAWTQFDVYGSEDPSDSAHIMYSYSQDRGKTWMKPVRINQFGGNCKDDAMTPEGAVPVAGPNGVIYVAWSYDEKIYFDRSMDGGVSWLKKDIVAAQQPGGWSFNIEGLGRANGLPVIACDMSYGDHHGNIYICWTDQRNGAEDTDVWVVRSSDQGNTWSHPVRVNDDEGHSHQFYSWLATDPITGYVYIVFYDRRNYYDDNTDVYIAWSSDGGVTFTNERVSEKPFRGNTNTFFGDYNNIQGYAGMVRPVWTHIDENGKKVMTAIIDISE